MIRKLLNFMKRPKTVLFFILYNFFAIIVLFSVMELTTRTLSWVSGKGFKLALHELEAYDSGVEGIYAWHPFTGFTFRPNWMFVASHSNSEEKPTSYTDKYGFLVRASDQNLTYKKPENEIRIATIGASTTANLNLSYTENWPGYLGELVQQHFPEKTVRVINAGVPGFDTAESIGNLALRVMPFQPDVVIIYHLYNDLKAIRPQINFKPDYSHIHTTPFGYHKKPGVLVTCMNNSMFYVRTRNLYREYKKNKASLKLASASNIGRSSSRISYIPQEAYNTFKQHIISLESIATSGGARTILSSFATLHNPNHDWSEVNQLSQQFSKLKKMELVSMMHFTPGLTLEGIFNGIQQYNNLLKEVAMEKGAGWVDNGSLIPHEDMYFVDRVHFSEKGAKQMAENFLPVVLEKLNEK